MGLSFLRAGAGTLLAHLLHPFTMVREGAVSWRSQSPYLQPDPERVARALEPFQRSLDAWVPPYSPGAAAVLAGIVFVVLARVMRALRRRERPSLRSSLSATAVGAISVPALTFAGIGALYVWGITPSHAMGEKYLASVWPLLACIPVGVVRLVPLGRGWLLAGLVCLGAIHSWAQVPHLRDPWSAVGPSAIEAHHVTFDAYKRAYVARYLPRLPDTARVFVAEPKTIRKRFDVWTRELDGALWIRDLKGKKMKKEREQLRKKLSKAGFRIQRDTGYERKIVRISRKR